MEHFTPVSASCGGAMIGAAAALLWIANGRIAGISGIAGGLLSRPANDTAWRIAFIAGLIAAPIIYAIVAGAPRIVIDAGPLRLIVAGLAVGFGTRLGSGCTSGHGVCGIARLSPRSIAATGIFMTTAALTVWASHGFIGGGAP